MAVKNPKTKDGMEKCRDDEEEELLLLENFKAAIVDSTAFVVLELNCLALYDNNHNHI